MKKLARAARTFPAVPCPVMGSYFTRGRRAWMVRASRSFTAILRFPAVEILKEAQGFTRRTQSGAGAKARFGVELGQRDRQDENAGIQNNDHASMIAQAPSSVPGEECEGVRFPRHRVCFFIRS
jgi:hypothetical protein